MRMERSKWLTIWHQWIATASIGIIKSILLYSLDYSPKHLCHSLLHQLPDPARGKTPSAIKTALHTLNEKHQQAKQSHSWRRAMPPKNAGQPLPKIRKRILTGRYKGSEELSRRPCWLPGTTFHTKAEPPSCSCPAAGLPLTNTFFPFC